MNKLVSSCMIVLSLAALQAPSLAAQTPEASILSQIGLDQKLNAEIPLDLEFTDSSGQAVRLGQYFGKRPVLLTLVYYECPMLCTLVLNGTVRALRTLEFSAGKEFDVVTVSINPNETPELAAAKKTQYIDSYRREGAAKGWHFLTGREDQIKQLADAVGFRYVYDAKSKQFAHPSGIILLTPGGKVSRYFYGVEYSPRDIRLGMVEAAKEKIGSPVDQLLLCCYRYDPSTGKYSLQILNFLRLAGAVTVVGIGLLLFVLIRKGHHQASAES
jgi:protein SCO1